MEEQLITQMGLMLTQLKGMRSSLDQVAQATSRYAGFAFAEAFTAGGRFGAPPLRGGALVVYVSNIRDLVASSGIAGFFEGLLGGVGRFFGGLFGGLIGGTIAGVTLPYMIAKIDSVVTNLRNILDRLGIGSKPAAPAQPSDAAAAVAPAASVEGRPLSDQIGEFRDILGLITGLLETSGSGAPAPERLQASLTPQGQQWTAMLRSVEGIVGGLTRLVNGLIILVPILIGSLALLIDKLDAIKLAIVEMFQFILRNVMLLRGVVLVTVFDLLGAAARLAAGLVQVIGTMLQGILSSIFGLAATVLQGALAVFQFLAGGLQRTVNGMLGWLVDTLFVVLARFGDLRIFRLVTHLIQVLPAVLPPLYELLRGSSPPLTRAQQRRLDAAAALSIPGPAIPSGSLPSSLLPKMPNPADLVTPGTAVAELTTQLNLLRDGLVHGVGDLSGAVQTGFAGLSARFDTMVRDELSRTNTDYAGNLRTVRERSTEFASAFGEAERAVRERPQTGLEAIARAYEQWLASDGLRSLLDQITAQFAATPPGAAGSIPGRVVGETVDRPRASIEIQEVVIDLTPTTAEGEQSNEGMLLSAEALYTRLMSYLRELRLRGADGDPALIAP